MAGVSAFLTLSTHVTHPRRVRDWEVDPLAHRVVRGIVDDAIDGVPLNRLAPTTDVRIVIPR